MKQDSASFRLLVHTAMRVATHLAREASWALRARERWERERLRRHWVFVTGCNRSGKTIVSNLLANHPNVAVIPNANSCTSALPESGAEGCPHVWTEKLDRFRLTEDSDTVPAARLTFDWLNQIDSSPYVVVESDVAAAQGRWLQRTFPGCAVVGILRNGYAVARGIWLKERYSIDRCAAHWRAVNTTMMGDAERMERFMLLRYEDLVRAPHATIANLARFLGIDFDPLRRGIDAGWRLGNLDVSTAQLADRNPSLIAELSVDDVQTITRCAGDLLRQLGYQASSGTGPRQ